jgi:anti-anti-sigma regulatory factor
LRSAAAPFLSSGVALGQRVLLLAPQDDPAAGGDDCHDPDGALRQAQAEGVLVVRTVESVYGGDGLDGGYPPALRELDRELDRALSGGFTGLRVLSVLTPLALDAATRGRLARWEHVAGHWQSTRPVTSGCALDHDVLGQELVRELACLHEHVIADLPLAPFRLFHRDGSLVLAGEIDAGSAPLLRGALTHLRTVPGERVEIDAAGVTFLNHHGLLALAAEAERRGVLVALRNAPTVTARLQEALGIGGSVLEVTA